MDVNVAIFVKLKAEYEYIYILYIHKTTLLKLHELFC